MDSNSYQKRTLFPVIGGAVFFAMIIFYPAASFGQGIGISISPLTFEITANPGDKVSNVLKVLNNSDSALGIQMNAEDFTAVGETGEVVVKGELNDSYSLAKWITVEPEQFTLDPHSQQLVNFTIEVPANGEPGGHYGSILATIGGTTATGTGAAISQKVGSLLLLQVAGPVNELLFVKGLEAPSFSEYGPVTIDARFENRGSVHLKPRGFIQVTDIFGKQVANLSLSQKNILPGSVRKIDTVWDRKILFGRYTATLTAIYGSTNEPLIANVSFWVIPWKITLGIFFGALLILSILIKSRRRLSLAAKVLFRGDVK